MNVFHAALVLQPSSSPSRLRLHSDYHLHALTSSLSFLNRLQFPTSLHSLQCSASAHRRSAIRRLRLRPKSSRVVLPLKKIRAKRSGSGGNLSTFLSPLGSCLFRSRSASLLSRRRHQIRYPLCSLQCAIKRGGGFSERLESVTQCCGKKGQDWNHKHELK